MLQRCRHGLARHSVRTLSRAASNKSVAIVGSGPAGFYTVQELLRSSSHKFSVDIFEKAPVPFGLVRYGVAPDHPEVKNCITTFEEIVSRPNVSFLGNVDVGRDVEIKELLAGYDAVVLAYGAGSDAKLDIPGEWSNQCFTATQFVGWFNGVPEYRDLNPDLSSPIMPIIGNGNVALDCARILAAPISHLEKTDISQHALDIIQQRKIEEISLYGRRGILQFKGTIKEVREITKLDNVSFATEIPDIQTVRDLVSTLPRPKKRLTELLLKYSDTKPNPDHINLSIKCGYSPTEILTDSNNNVSGLVLQRNLIEGDSITPTQEFHTINCKSIVKSIGYKVIQLPGVPFCNKTSRIPEDNSRVLEHSQGPVIPGLYTSGWARRGSDGVIASTINDSIHTANCVLTDLDYYRIGGKVKESFDVKGLLADKGVNVVTFEDWKVIDEKEREEGSRRGKPREKITCHDRIKDLLTKGDS